MRIYLATRSDIKMPDKIEGESDFKSSISELESLGLSPTKLNELNGAYEIGNLVENLKQMHIQDYKSTSTSTFTFTD